MAGIFQLTELAGKKELLVAESNLRRETLKVEWQNLQLYGVGLRAKFDGFRSRSPLLLLAPVLGLLFGPPLKEVIARRRQRRERWVRLALSLLFSLRAYRRLRPLLKLVLSRRNGTYTESEPTGPEQETETPAANI